MRRGRTEPVGLPRFFGVAVFAGLAAAFSTGAPMPADVLDKIDHLVYAVPDLEAGVRGVQDLLGVRATPGGQHPGGGTRNALLALGPACYLEIIGPDAEQPAPARPRSFGIDGLKVPRLVTWAAKSTDLDQLAARAAALGVRLGAVSAGSRKRPDGLMLSWRYTNPATVVADGLVPFFIDWGATPHPALTAAPGAILVGLRAEHPDPERVRALLGRLDLGMQVDRGPAPALIATISGRHGRVELR
jgi:hypothetical protein